MDHPILQVVAEGHDAHLVDDVEAARPIEVEDGVERSGGKQFVVKTTDLTNIDKSGGKQPTICVENIDLTNMRWTWDGGRRSTHCQ